MHGSGSGGWVERAILALVVGAGILAAPDAAIACSSVTPTFAETVQNARAIARVTIVEGFDSVLEDPNHSETYRVDRVLKGSLPELVTVAPAWTSYCHDTVSYFAGPEGQTILVAFDMASRAEVIHPMWGEADGVGLFGTAELPAGVTTLSDVESAILRQLGLPDTSSASATPGDPGLPWPLFAALGVLAAVRVLRRQQRRAG